MLMVNDHRHYMDTFWFTLFHEIGHIMNHDYGITFDGNKNDSETRADLYAQGKLIPSSKKSLQRLLRYRYQILAEPQGYYFTD